MAISLKHAFTSNVADSPDATLVQPSNWNAEHTITMATGRLLGRTTANTGAVEEISVAGNLTLSGGSLTGSEFPAGTAILFQQTAAPTGWTKSTTHNDKALRVVSGAASSGGTTAFSTVFASRTPAGTISNTTATGTISNTTSTGTVGATTLTTAQIPAHTHGYGGIVSGGTGKLTTAGSTTIDLTATSDSTGGGGSHTHSLTMNAHNHTFTGTAHNHTFTGTAMDFAVQYVDIIIATKN